MPTLRSSSLVGRGALAPVLVALTLGAVTPAAESADKTDVRVINTPAEAVPVAVTGTPTVNVGNTPSVSVVGTPTVNLATDTFRVANAPTSPVPVMNGVPTDIFFGTPF